MSQQYADQHRDTLDGALEAIQTRAHFSAYPESPSPRVHGEEAAPAGQQAFEALLGTDFPVDTPGASGTVATERSPFGIALDVRYPRVTPAGVDALLTAARRGLPRWRDAGPDVRAGVCLEILARLHARIFELAHSVMHTSGQAFVMAFQAGGAHALDRGLESVAYAYAEMTRHPQHVRWEKPAKGEPLQMDKRFHVVGKGVALLVGCNTFPTWNSFPAFFASLATGNAVVVKPHPGAVLPLALTVQTARAVLSDAGFDPDLVTLAAEDPSDRLAATLATRPEVKVVDFTGSGTFGRWLEENATQAVVYAEKNGVNHVVVDSTDDFRGMCANLGFSLSLYTGQMCTTPQNILLPHDGIDTDEGHKSFDEVGAGIAAAVDRLLGDDARAVELLGGVVNADVLARLESAQAKGTPVLTSRAVAHPAFPDATVRTPAVLAVDVKDEDAYGSECFGPVSYLVATDGTDASLDLFRRTVTEKGAMTASVYSRDERVLDAAEQVAVEVGVHLSCNLTDGVYVNQSAAFSDFHGTAGNPAASATLTDGAFVAGRFLVVQSRRHAPAAASNPSKDA
ncbi:MAG: phenylacetic acid degradation protein PaaN [Actinomycetes bacterium]